MGVGGSDQSGHEMLKILKSGGRIYGQPLIRKQFHSVRIVRRTQKTQAKRRYSPSARACKPHTCQKGSYRLPLKKPSFLNLLSSQNGFQME